MVYINNVDITEAQSLCLLPRCTSLIPFIGVGLKCFS